MVEILKARGRGEIVTVASLARQMDRTRSTMHEICASLRNKGYLEDRRSEGIYALEPNAKRVDVIDPVYMLGRVRRLLHQFRDDDWIRVADLRREVMREPGPDRDWWMKTMRWSD